MSKVLIFGGSGGIGSALAARIVAAGGQVVITGRDVTRLAEAASRTGAAHTIVCDATRSDQVDAATAEAVATLGGLTAVVNCVGSILLKPAHLTSDAEFDDVIRQNLTSAFYVLRAGVKVLRREGGSIALCSSAAAQAGLANHEAIAAAKGGIISLVRSAAASYASAKVRINAVAPGLVDTPMAARITQNPGSLKVSQDMHRLGRIGTAEDVASALAWLVDPAQTWVTGQIIGVEGGLTLK